MSIVHRVEPGPWVEHLYLPSYLQTDVARYVGVPRQTVARWRHLFGLSHKRPPRHARSTPLSFEELITVAFIAALRRSGIDLDDAHRMHDSLRGALEDDYPFTLLAFKTRAPLLLGQLGVEDVSRLGIVTQHGRYAWAAPILAEFERFDYDLDIAAGTPRVCYDNHQLYHNHSAWSFVPWHHLSGVDNGSITKSVKYNPSASEVESGVRDRSYLEDVSREFNLKYVVAIMNSRFARNYLQMRRRSNLHLFPDDWKPLPIARVPLSGQRSLVTVVDEILSLYEHYGFPLPAEATPKLAALQALIDQEVDVLYANAAIVVAVSEGVQESSAGDEAREVTIMTLS